MISHVKSVTIADSSDTSIVRPSDWNSVHSQIVTLAGNTSNASLVSGTNIVLHGGSNITLYGTSDSLSIIGPNTSQFITTAMLSNRGTDFVQATAGFNGTNASGTIASNSISVSVGNYITTARASTDAIGLNTAKTNVTWTVNSIGLSIDAGGYLTTAMASNRASDFVAATAGFNGTNASGTIASNSISISVGNYITTAALSTMGIYASSNTYLTSSGTHDARSLSFRGDKSITIGISGSEVMFSVGAYITTAMLSNAVTISSASTFFGGISNLGNTSGSTGLVDQRLVLVGSNGITLSGSTDAALHSATITISGAVGGAQQTISYWNNMDAVQGTVSQTGANQSTSVVFPFYVPFNLSASYIRFPVSGSIANSTSLGTTANAVVGLTISSTINIVVYSLGVGASSRSLQSFASASASWQQRVSVSANANGSQFTSGWLVSFPREGAASISFSTQDSVSSTRYDFASSRISDFTSNRFLDVPFASSLTPGAYWMAYGSSTSMSTSSNNALSQLIIKVSNIVVTQPNVTFGLMGSATNSSNAHLMGIGSYTTNAIGTTASIALANISSSASHPIMPFEMIRQA